MTIAPWLIPPDFIGASRAGAEAGLQRSRIATGANEAAGRLGLGYAQLAQEGASDAARAAAAREQAAAALALRQEESLAERIYRGTKLDQDNRGLDIEQQRADAYAANSLKGETTAKAASKLFGMAGKTRDEFNKEISSDPEMQAAAATLTGPQWTFLLPKEPTVSIPIGGNILGRNQTRVSGPLGAVLPLVGTNAPEALRAPAVKSTGRFESEWAARAAGHKSGDVIYLQGVGRVRLK